MPRFFFDFFGRADSKNRDAHELHHALRRLAHRNLPRIELSILTAHGDQRQKRKTAALE
jgi:hypothetical protein